ncbi:MAG: radical SAM protein [Nitrospirae bacterium]|nr:radical SAM protein [Nitrospirota bacterium]
MKEFGKDRMKEGEVYKEERRDILRRYEITDWRSIFTEKYGDRFLEYRRLWELANKAAILASYPLEISFEISDRCNYRCSFCPRNSEFKRALNFELGKENVSLPFAAYKEVIDDGKRNNLFSVSFSTGAEALIEKDLPKFIEYARTNDVVDIRVTTNGFMLNEENIRILVDGGATFIGISIDAYRPETYKLLRKHDLQRIVNNVMNLVEYKRTKGSLFPITRVSFVKTKENIGEMQDFLDFWKDKADIIDFQDLYTYEYCAIEKARENKFFCAQPWQRANVWADGKVSLCCSWTAQKEAVGSIYEYSMKEIWNSAKATAFRESLTGKNYLEACLWCVASSEKIAD